MSTVDAADDSKSHKTYKFVVNSNEYHSSDRLIDGREILERSGHRPANEHVLIRIEDGRTVAVDDELKIDLKEDGDETFRAFSSDRVFLFSVEDRSFEWGAPGIDESELRKICAIAESQVFRLERTDGADEIVDDGSPINLNRNGTEHLRIAHRPEVTVTVNKNAVRLSRGWTTGAAIKEAAIAQGVNIRPDFVLDQEFASGDSNVIGDLDPVFIKGGERFGAVDHHEDS